VMREVPRFRAVYGVSSRGVSFYYDEKEATAMS
jgi:hypothetical protein